MVWLLITSFTMPVASPQLRLRLGQLATRPYEHSNSCRVYFLHLICTAHPLCTSQVVTDDPSQPELTECLLRLGALERLDLFLVEPPADLGRALAKLHKLRTLVIAPYAGEAGRVREVNPI